MTAQDLLTQFRNEMMDTHRPYFWSDEEILGYMNDAYKMFVRLMGGIADFTSDLTRVDIVAGDPIGLLDRRILRITEAARVSDGRNIEIKNYTDVDANRLRDVVYGMVRSESLPGPVKMMVIGAERGKCKWIQVPETDDQAQLSVYRLPIGTVDIGGSNLAFGFDEVGEEHVTNFCPWMRYRAYQKADADVFDPKRGELFKAQFTAYCDQTKREWERYKHKNREVQYGGL